MLTDSFYPLRIKSLLIMDQWLFCASDARGSCAINFVVEKLRFCFLLGLIFHIGIPLNERDIPLCMIPVSFIPLRTSCFNVISPIR